MVQDCYMVQQRVLIKPWAYPKIIVQQKLSQLEIIQKKIEKKTLMKLEIKK
jgi:hypothetical protein